MQLQRDPAHANKEGSAHNNRLQKHEDTFYALVGILGYSGALEITTLLSVDSRTLSYQLRKPAPPIMSQY